MTSQIPLDAKENAKVKLAIPTASNKIYYVARARIYQAYAGTKKWSYAGLQGALAFILNTSSNKPHFQMIDLDGRKGVIWDYELHDGLVLDQDETVTFFLSFEGDVGGDKFVIGFVFMDDSEAKTFYNHFKSNKDTKSDPSWLALFEDLDGQFGNHEMEFIKDFVQNYSEPQPTQPVGAPMRQISSLLSPRTRSHTPRFSLFRRTARTQPPQVAPNRPMKPVLEDDQISPQAPTHAPPAKPLRSIPQHGDVPLPQEIELKHTKEETQYSHPRYSKPPPSPRLLSHSISRNRSTPSSIIPSRSASSAARTRALIQRQESHTTQIIVRPTSISGAVHEDEVESLTPDANQTMQLPSQGSPDDTPSWILVSRKPHAPKKSEDPQFMARMANIRRQTDESDASSTGSTPPVSLIGTQYSITSSAFSQSLSVTSFPPIVEFPPAPVFMDEIPEGLIRKVK